MLHCVIFECLFFCALLLLAFLYNVTFAQYRMSENVYMYMKVPERFTIYSCYKLSEVIKPGINLLLINAETTLHSLLGTGTIKG